MELRILGWRYENIRGGLRDVSISLDSAPGRWTLIQMPNGTGKTTTMLLLRVAFGGETLTEQEVCDLRSTDDAVSGMFELRLSIDGKPFRIQLRLDFKNGTYQYWTARSEVRSGGLQEGLSLPAELKRLLSRDFTRLFVFDGELAKEIRTVGKDRAANAIRILYRLDRLDMLNVQVDRLVDEQQQRAAAISTATERKGVTRWKRQYEAASARRVALGAEQKQLQKRRKEMESRKVAVAALISGRIDQDASLRERKEKLDRERQTIDLSLVEALHLGMSGLRTPAKIHSKILDRLLALGGKLTLLKLPKTISAEFFKELAQQADCVCGRSITPPIKEAILKRADDYLAEDQILVINKMKSALRESSADPKEFTDVVAQLSGIMRELRQNKMAHDQLELDRVDSGDTELEQLRAENAQLDQDLESNTQKLERLTTRDPARQRALSANSESNIPLCDAEVKRCQEKLATATDTLRFVLQSERVKELVLAASELAQERLRERVRVATNEKLALLAPSEALRVSKIGGALELKSGRLSSKSGVSEGQSLAVAYAFLTSLLTEAPYKLPFIVDSPAVSLDTAVRREVGDLIPDLFDQMIMFVISSEREGFADAFYDRDGVRYITLWRDGEDVTQVHDGLDVFRAFHQREEAE
jgi:energy-coupling factor transporter ATP-binding protein EcfA2